MFWPVFTTGLPMRLTRIPRIGTRRSSSSTARFRGCLKCKIPSPHSMNFAEKLFRCAGSNCGALTNPRESKKTANPAFMPLGCLTKVYPPLAIGLVFEVVDLSYPGLRELFFVGIEHPEAELSKAGRIMTLTTVWAFPCIAFTARATRRDTLTSWPVSSVPSSASRPK